MSAYTRWRAEYEPASDHFSSMLDEIEQIREDLWRHGHPDAEAAAQYRAKLAEAEEAHTQLESLREAMPEPSIADKLGWGVLEFVRHSPRFPQAVGYAVLFLVFAVAIAIDRLIW